MSSVTSPKIVVGREIINEFKPLKIPRLVGHVVAVNRSKIHNEVTRYGHAQSLYISNIPKLTLLWELITYLQVDDFKVLLLQCKLPTQISVHETGTANGRIFFTITYWCILYLKVLNIIAAPCASRTGFRIVAEPFENL